MNEAYQFFIAESLRHARALPFGDCVRFLGGMLSAMPQDSVPQIREVHTALVQCDEQLDLIQVGQIKFEFVFPGNREATRSASSAL